MSSDHHTATLTDGEVAWLLQAGGRAVQPGSPFLPFVEVAPDADQASLQERGVTDPAWGTALAVLTAPDRQIRMIIPGPAETLIQVYYGSRSHPQARLVGCWLEGNHLRVSFPWEEEDVAAITARVVLATPPPLADPHEVSLSVGGLQALAGAVDAVRGRLFSSLGQRQPVVAYRFAHDDVRHQLAAGTQHDDARWLVTLLRVLSPLHVKVADGAAEAGFDELAEAGIIRNENGQWTPEAPLLAYASQWRSPLPAVAHEIIEMANGELRRYEHRITIRGDGPLTLVDYQGLLAGQPIVSIKSVDAIEYLDGLIDLLQPGPDGHQGAWVYVLERVQVQGLHDTSAVIGILEPGIWYLLVSEEGGWARIADPDGHLEGWAPAAQIHHRSDPVDPEPTPLPGAAEPAWAPSHTVPREGLEAWAAPDPAGQVIATLAGGIELLVVERRADWAQVRAENGWEAWLDGRRLQVL